MINTLTNSKPVTHEEIAHYAYLLWEADGKPEGRDVDYWVKAETILYTSEEGTKNKTVQVATSEAPKAKARKKTVKAPKTKAKAKAEATRKKAVEAPAATPEKKAVASKTSKAKAPAAKKKSAKRSTKKSSGTA